MDTTSWMADAVKDVIQNVTTDPILQLVENSPGWKKQQLANSLHLEDMNATTPLCACLSSLVTSCVKKVYEKKFTHAGTLEMFEQLTEKSLSSEVSLEWKGFIGETEYDDKTVDNLLQHLIEEIFPKFIAQTSKVIQGENASPSSVTSKSLDKDEEQILYYASGYIPRKLLKRYEKQRSKNEVAALYTDIVGTWFNSDDDIDLSPDITSWVDIQDRGGLLHVNADFYHFIHAVELELRQFWGVQFIKRYKDQDVIPLFLKELKVKDTVLYSWKHLVKNDIVSEVVSECLFEETIKVWIGMRVRQVVNVYMFTRKESGSSTGSRKGAPALRKTLDKFY